MAAVKGYREEKVRTTHQGHYIHSDLINLIAGINEKEPEC